MQCRQARQKLSDCDWQADRYRTDADLMAHLDQCAECRRVLEAELTVRRDLAAVREGEPGHSLDLAEVRRAVMSGAESGRVRTSSGWWSSLVFSPRYRTQRWGVAAVTFGMLVLLAFVPFTFQEKVGYEITIAGVDRTIAEDTRDISPLLRALGMEQDKASRLIDSLGADRVRLSLGECSETCQLRISDLKTERDVKLVVRAIIALGCCQIDRVVPVYKNESSSVLMHVARKLNS